MDDSQIDIPGPNLSSQFWTHISDGPRDNFTRKSCHPPTLTWLKMKWVTLSLKKLFLLAFLFLFWALSLGQAVT